MGTQKNGVHFLILSTPRRLICHHKHTSTPSVAMCHRKQLFQASIQFTGLYDLLLLLSSELRVLLPLRRFALQSQTISGEVWDLAKHKHTDDVMATVAITEADTKHRSCNR